MYVDYKKLGNRIAARRKELGLKQSQVNEMAGLSDKYLSHIETARTIPSIDVLMKICNALDVTPNYLLLGTINGQDNFMDNIKQKINLINEKDYILLSKFIDLLIGLNNSMN